MVENVETKRNRRDVQNTAGGNEACLVGADRLDKVRELANRRTDVSFSVGEGLESEENLVNLQPKKEKEAGNGRQGNADDLEAAGVEKGVSQRKGYRRDTTESDSVATREGQTPEEQSPEYRRAGNSGQLSVAHVQPTTVRKTVADTSQPLTNEQKDFVENVKKDAETSIFPITVVDSIKDFVDALRKEGAVVEETDLENDKEITPALYLPSKGKIFIYPKGLLFANRGDIRAAEENYLSALYHEGKAHFGLKTLLGNHFGDFCDSVWDGMSAESRRTNLAYQWDNDISAVSKKKGEISKEKILADIGSDKSSNTKWRELSDKERSDILTHSVYGVEMRQGAADEYVAHSAGDMGRDEFFVNLSYKVEEGEPFTKDERTIWNSFKEWMRNFFNVDRLSDEEIADLVRISSGIFDGMEVEGTTEAEREANRQTQLRDLRTRAGRIRGGVSRRRAQRQATANKANTLANNLKVDVSVDDDAAPTRFSIGNGEKDRYTLDPETGKISLVSKNNRTPKDVERSILTAVTQRGNLRDTFETKIKKS